MRYLRLPIIAICLLVFSSCRNNQIEDSILRYEEIISTTTPIIGDIPDEITLVWPLPESEIDFSSYHKTLTSGHSGILREIGVGVEIFLLEIDDPLAGGQLSVPDRIFLVIDGELVEDETQIYDGLQATVEYDPTTGETEGEPFISGPYYISWLTPLSEGKHLATFYIISNTGEIIGYSWSFEISNTQ